MLPFLKMSKTQKIHNHIHKIYSPEKKKIWVQNTRWCIIAGDQHRMLMCTAWAFYLGNGEKKRREKIKIKRLRLDRCEGMVASQSWYKNTSTVFPTYSFFPFFFLIFFRWKSNYIWVSLFSPFYYEIWWKMRTWVTFLSFLPGIITLLSISQTLIFNLFIPSQLLQKRQQTNHGCSYNQTQTQCSSTNKNKGKKK